MKRLCAIGLVAALVGACSDEIDAGGVRVDAGADSDPLTSIESSAEPGSLEDLHQTIISQRCSGQPGLCHNGQFEPNLSTPANTYAYLVNRPSIEKPNRLRVDPNNPGDSVLIDKLRGRDVGTIMPLGADPLTEEEIKLFEDWISNGALRKPNASPAPVLNNKPKAPEIAVYDDQGARLDMAGAVRVSVGSTIVLRHSVHDFETPDQSIGFATFILSAPDGRNVTLDPTAMSDQHLGLTTYDASGPMGNGDLLNYRFAWTIPATVGLRDDETGAIEQVPAAGLVLTPIAFIVDAFPNGIVAFTVSNRTITLE